MVCFFFMVCEIIGGLVSGSLAILTDAAHMLSDVAGFGISMFSIWISKKSPSHKSSYGYHRAEVLGALGSIIIIWLMVAWLFYEATNRILYELDNKIDAPVMLITSFISLVCNLFSLSILGHFPCGSKGENPLAGVKSVYQAHGGHDCGHDHGHGHHHHHHGHSHSHGPSDHDHHDHQHDHDHDHDIEHSHKHSHKHSHHEEEAENINIRAAVVHVIGDLLQSIGVIIAALLIYYDEDYQIADPICTYVFSILVMFTTVPVFKSCMNVLMEQEPIGFDSETIKE